MHDSAITQAQGTPRRAWTCERWESELRGGFECAHVAKRAHVLLQSLA